MYEGYFYFRVPTHAQPALLSFANCLHAQTPFMSECAK